MSTIVLLAKNWDPDITNPKGWWMSEKLDGIRALWDGKNFISRNGLSFPAPDYFTKQMPKLSNGKLLDGELWLGRGMFEQTSSIVRCGSVDKGWNQLMYMVFDAPSTDYRFETRLSYVKEVIRRSKVCRFVDHIECSGKDHVFKALENVVEAGGEGLMLRKPGSKYEKKKSYTLLKVKKYLDEEATVVGHQPGKNKYTGALGALECKLENGVEFEMGQGFSDYDRDHPPKIGDLVTFKHLGFMKSGKPRNAIFVRVRKPGE